MEIRKEKRFIAHRYSRAILFNHYKLFFDPIFQTSSVVKFSKLVTIYWRINIDTFRCSLVSSPPCFFPPQIFPRDGLLIGDFLSVKKKEKKTKKRNRASREISWKNDVLIFVRYLFKYIGGGFPQFTPSAQRTYKG